MASRPLHPSKKKGLPIRLRWTISVKIGMVFLAFMLMTATNLVVVHGMLRDLNGVAETVNVAGKLRMLSQKIAFETVKAIQQNDAIAGEPIALLDQFASALAALKGGGAIFGYSLDGLPEKYAVQLGGMETSLASYRTDVQAALRSSFPASGHRDSLRAIASDAERLLGDAEFLVKSLTEDARLAQHAALMHMYMLLLLDAAVLTGSFVVLRRQIVFPLRALAQQSIALGEGRYSYPLMRASNDEIGQLSSTLSSSFQRIGELIAHIELDRRNIERTEAMFRGLAENSVAGVYIVQGDTFRYVNRKMADMFSYEVEDMLSLVSVFDIVPDSDRQLVEESIRKRLGGEIGEAHYERKARKKDGSTFDVEVFGSKMEIDGQTAIIGIMLDITQRKRVERALHVLTACNQALLRATEEQALLADICSIYQKISNYPFVWAGYASKNAEKSIIPVAFAEMEQGSLGSVAHNITWDLSETGMGVTGLAVRTGRTTVLQDVVNNPDFSSWCRFLKSHGILAAISLPLRAGNEIIGALTVYSEEENAFTSDEVRIAEELSENLSYGIAALRAEAEKMQYARQLEFNANHDVLTGLANRTLLSDRLRLAFASAERNGDLVALLLLDLDRFKVINDSLGHAAGDVLLQAVARRLVACVRGTDTVARLGGDEFVVVMPSLVNEEAAKIVASKVLEILARPFYLDEHEVYVSASIGISLYPRDGSDEETLMKNVDLAMYRAKQSGRSHYQFYTEEIYLYNLARHAMEVELHSALQRDELVLHFQPKVDLIERRITGLEALVRWNHPARGMVFPDDFIPLAEDTGLIIPIGSWVLKQACLQNKAWQNAGLPRVRMAVNLSVRQFQHNDLVGLVKEALAESGLEPQYLELELTESIIMQEEDGAIATLVGLKAMGIQISLDDFGTGYSSLNYLRRFPLDNLKIDRFFVKGITAHSHDTTIVKALITLAHNLNLKVTAEGVETREELDFLRLHHCDEIQGYYFSKPVPAAVFHQLLLDGKFFSSKAA